MESVLPDRAQVLIIGGGVVGCSVAYHLARRGWTDVVLLERNQLTSGTTWHAAGLITTARPTSAMRRVVKRSIEVFETLEADTGLSTGWEQTGTLHLATNAPRWEELLRQASVTKPDDIEVAVLNVEATIAKYPLLSADGLVGSLFYPGDGRGNATDTTMSLARGARNRGVQIFENIGVAGIRRDGRRVTGVDTPAGSIECEYVVNCGGMWGREIGAMAGVQVPLQALAHYYVITEAIPGLARGLPTIKSSDEWTYVKNEGDGLMVGFFEPGSYPWQPHGIPGDAAFVQLPDDWDHLGPFYAGVMERIPALADAGIRLFFGGPESFTPDGVYHFGEAPELQNFFIAAGFNSTGFLTGPGIGSVMADWLVDGRPPSISRKRIRRASCHTRPTVDSSSNESLRHSTSPTTCTGRTTNGAVPARCGAAPYMRRRQTAARCSASSVAGSVPTGSLRQAYRGNIATRTAARTGSSTQLSSIRQYVRRSARSTSRHTASSRCKAAMHARTFSASV
ncbi:MAG TPA: FAD-binding oxidoreductase, partial [Ilumatobacteraceae bacterium]|nr:FAD-binding oxidoreductase [Ilumatobacteraceae bacterium]